MRLYGREAAPQEPEELERELALGRAARLQDDERLRHEAADRVRARHDRRLGDRLVLDERALQLERADAVVRALEDVVGAADVGDVAVGVPLGDVARVVVAVPRVTNSFRSGSPSYPAMRPAGRGIERDADLALLRASPPLARRAARSR